MNPTNNGNPFLRRAHDFLHGSTLVAFGLVMVILAAVAGGSIIIVAMSLLMGGIR